MIILVDFIKKITAEDEVQNVGHIQMNTKIDGVRSWE